MFSQSFESKRNDSEEKPASPTLSNLFSRQIQAGKLIPEIDGLRFLAILLVVLHHIHGFIELKNHFTYNDQESFSSLRNWMIDARRGVELFFVISGFILALPFAKAAFTNTPSPSVRKYFLRRLTRLEPPYILALILLALYQFGSGRMDGLFVVKSFFASIFYIHNIVFEWPSYLLPVAWSLELEVQFYVIAPLLFTIFYLPKNWRRTILLFVILLAPWLQSFYQTWTFLLVHYFHYFLTGLLLADLYLERPSLNSNSRMASLAGGLLLMYIVFSPHVRTHVIQNDNEILLAQLFPLAIGAFYYLVLTNIFWRKIFSIRAVSVIGGMCYSLYLVHLAVISGMMRFLVNHQFSQSYGGQLLVYILVCIPVVLLSGAIFFLVIEKPCMNPNWPNHLKHKFLNAFK